VRSASARSVPLRASALGTPDVVGIGLSVTKTAEVFRAISDAADVAAGHTAGHIRWRDKKRATATPTRGATVARDEGSWPSVVRSGAAAWRAAGP
jgi:hypothetical protein